MYSCINQPRGCRGRVNTSGGRCESCRVCSFSCYQCLQNIQLANFHCFSNSTSRSNPHSILATETWLTRDLRSTSTASVPSVDFQPSMSVHPNKHQVG